MKKLILPLNEIIDLYNLGDGCYKIANRFNCSPSTINNILKQNGVNTKKTPNDYRKFKLNEDYFSSIDSEYKAYFLGLIYSDGCISKTTLRISLQEEDGYILNKFVEQIGSDFNPYFVKKRKETHKNQKLMVISNVKIVNDLKKLGVNVKKSLILGFPSNKQIPTKYLNHFIRGMFDGDGSVYKYERNINGKDYTECGISITSSNHFISELKKKIQYGNVHQINDGKNSALFIKNKNEIAKFINYIYKDSNIFLKRKHERAHEILSLLNNKKYFYSGEKITQYNLDGVLINVWNNIQEIKEKTNFNTQTILRNIRGKIKTSNNFKFEIYDK
jgi:intein-encoded DNA endonuclease-like protein